MFRLGARLQEKRYVAGRKRGMIPAGRLVAYGGNDYCFQEIRQADDGRYHYVVSREYVIDEVKAFETIDELIAQITKNSAAFAEAPYDERKATAQDKAASDSKRLMAVMDLINEW